MGIMRGIMRCHESNIWSNILRRKDILIHSKGNFHFLKKIVKANSKGSFCLCQTG